MAKVIFNNNPENRQVAGGYLTQLLTANLTAERRLASFYNGVKYKLTIRELSQNVTFQDAGSAFNPSTDATTIEGHTLEVVRYAFQRKIDFETLADVMQAENLPAGALNDYLGTEELRNAILSYYAEQIAVENDKLYWLGMDNVPAFSSIAAATRAKYPGILPAMIADANVPSLPAPAILAITGLTRGATTTITHASGANDNLEIGDVVTFSDTVNGTTQIRGLSGAVLSKTATTTVVNINSTSFSAYTSGGTITCINKVNVADQLARLYNAMEEAVKNDPRAVMLVSGRIADAYKLNQSVAGGNGANNRYYLGEKELDFLGVPIIRMPHWLPNCIVVAVPELNFHIGFDDEGDEENINVQYLGQTTMEKVYGVDIQMKSNAIYANRSQILMFKPAIQA